MSQHKRRGPRPVLLFRRLGGAELPRHLDGLFQAGDELGPGVHHVAAYMTIGVRCCGARANAIVTPKSSTARRSP